MAIQFSLESLCAICKYYTRYVPDFVKHALLTHTIQVHIWFVNVVNRQNTIRLEEKEKREKELFSQIIVEADEYKVEFHKKRQVTSETNKVTNREKEQVLVAKLEKFHAEADKDYWKSIAELIPKEVPTIEKRKGKKEQEKKASIVVVQGPKPGKPTDLSRMRQLLLKLKHNTPPHLKQYPTVAVTKEPMAVA